MFFVCLTADSIFNTVYNQVEEKQQINEQVNDMNSNFEYVLNYCKIKSLFEDVRCVKTYLKDNGDFWCDGELCCGGNSIGWYTCF